MNCYMTSYIDPVIIDAKSSLFRNYTLAERILFALLKDCRIVQNREFFNCPVDKIKLTIIYNSQVKKVKIR